MDTLRFTKGQGTGNDFVLLSDPDGALDLPPERVRVLAHRRFGVGGDGVIRAVRSASIPDGAAVLDEDPAAEWFMDYRNADGSVAEMCGNGIRVFGEYLVAEGLAEIAVGETVSIGTRAGARSLRRTEEGWAADLGPFTIEPGDELVAATGLDVDRPGLAIEIGNPHVVVALADDDELEALDLAKAPKVSPRPEHGANVEFVVPAEPLVAAGIGRIRMRVHERGSGETLSCGTGAAAAAIATRWWAGDSAPDSWEVRVPGGVLGVRMFGRGGVEHAELSGPGELMFTGVIEA